MIFLDETGKRWRRIKRGTGLVSSSILLPVGVLAVGSLLYLPTWNNLSLPNLSHTGSVLAAATSAVLGSNNSDKKSPSKTNTSTNSSQTAGTSKPSTVTNAQASSALTTSTASSTPPDTNPAQPSASPVPVVPGLADKTVKNDYGQSHKPTHS